MTRRIAKSHYYKETPQKFAGNVIIVRFTQKPTLVTNQSTLST